MRPKVVSIDGGRNDEVKARKEALAKRLRELADEVLSEDGSTEVVAAAAVLLYMDDDGTDSIRVLPYGATSLVVGALELAKHFALSSDYDEE